MRLSEVLVAPGKGEDRCHLPSCLLLRRSLVVDLPVRWGFRFSKPTIVRKVIAKPAQVLKIEWLATNIITVFDEWAAA